MFKFSILVNFFRALTPLISYATDFHLAAVLNLETFVHFFLPISDRWMEGERQAGREGANEWEENKLKRDGKLAICPTNLSRIVVS